MRTIKNESFDEERALYNSRGIELINCNIDGPKDGESALKESSDIIIKDSRFNLRYPFWHDNNLSIEGSEMTKDCRAAIWYSDNVSIINTKLHGIKALRESSNISITDCHIVSPEFGWFDDDISMTDSYAESEYFMLHSSHLNFRNVSMKGKYSFQYIKDSVFTDCNFDTKDAFWHAENITVKNSVVKGEYLAWYCENVTFDHCEIIGTQPLCYCKNLKLIDCTMKECDLAFEKSDVDATVLSYVDSIKNPASGTINVYGVGEMIMDDEHAKGIVNIIKR